MFSLHSADGPAGACVGLKVAVGVRLLCIPVGGRSGAGGRPEHLVGVRVLCILRSVGLVPLQVGRLWRVCVFYLFWGHAGVYGDSRGKRAQGS